jgi:hypothetical protein
MVSREWEAADTSRAVESRGATVDLPWTYCGATSQ